MPSTRCEGCKNCRYLYAARRLCERQPVDATRATAVVEFWNHAVAQPCLLPGRTEGQFVLADPEVDYLESIQEENGFYQNSCFCGLLFRGPKLTPTCKRCERHQTRRNFRTRLRDLYYGLVWGRVSHSEFATWLKDFPPEAKNGYYLAVFAAFQESLAANRVTFLAFTQDVAANIDELADLLTDLGVSPLNTSLLG